MKSFLLACLMLVTCPAWSEWVFFAKSGDSDIYIDPTTIRKDGDRRIVWSLQDLSVADRDGELSRRARSEYGCKDERTRFLSFSEHSGGMASGKTLYRSDDPGQWKNVAPGTVGALFLAYLCAK